jgi:hypothetical protein
MAHCETTFTTTAPADEAFAYLSRFSTTREWDPGVVDSTDLTKEPVGLGSAFEIVTSFAGRRLPLRYEIIAFDAPHLVTLQAENSSVRSTDTMRFLANDDGTTTITYDAELSPRGLTRLFGPVLTLMFQRIGDRAAVGLRAAVDGLARPVGDDPADLETERPA